MPAGSLVTVPPLPTRLSVSTKVSRAKGAVTFLGPSIVNEEVPAPVPAPDQPANVDVVSGVAERTTVWPPSKSKVQVEPQERPAGDDVTVPVPVPVRETLTGKRFFS